MFLKNNKTGYLKGAFLIVLMILLILCSFFRNEEEKTFQSVFSSPISNKIIVLDAGHGGFDSGAVANQVVEKEVNLKVTMKLKEYLEQSGAIVLLTRNKDVSTAEENSSGKSAKKSDMQQRKKLADESGCDIFVSIHMNQFSQEKYSGAQVFYSTDNMRSKALGNAIQKGMLDVLKNGNTRIAKKIDDTVFLLKNTTVPSVIVECGFLSNPQEASLLVQEDYQEKVAWGIYLGVLRYFNELT